MRHLLPLLLIFPFGLSFSQSHVFKHFGTANGLPSSEVYDITQDQWGYLWFSSDQGLCRYDGYEFKHFGVKEGLPDNTVFNFFHAPDGNIWVSTFTNELFIIQGEEPVFSDYVHNTALKKALPSPNLVIQSLYVSIDGGLFLVFLNRHGFLYVNPQGGTKNYLLDRIDRSIKLNHLFDSTGQGFIYSWDADCPDILPDAHQIKSLYEYPIHKGQFNRLGAVFFDSKPAVKLINGHTLIHGEPCLKKEIAEFENEAFLIKKFNDSLFWVSTYNGGLQLFDQNGSEQLLLLAGKSISGVHTDHEGKVWISTLNDGVFQFNNLEVRSPSQLPGNIGVVDIAKDSEANLWISYRDGEVWTRQEGNWQLVPTVKDKSGAHLVYHPYSNTMYYTAGVYLYSSSKNPPVHFGQCNGFFFNSPPSPDQIIPFHNSETFIKAIQTGEVIKSITKQRIHAGTFYQNKMYLAGKAGLFISEGDTAVLVNTKDLRLKSRLDDLCTMGDLLILASKGHGVLLYDGNELIEISVNQGLSSNFVNKLYPENDSTLWVCTNVGLNRIQFKRAGNFIIDRLNYEQGLMSNEVTAVEIVGDTVWVGTREGISTFHKKLMDRNQLEIDYNLKIQRLWVNDRKSKLDSSLNLAYHQNRIEFKFSGISFNQTQKLTYRYRLYGLENQWSYTKSRKALYPSLPPGQYRFEVQVKGQNQTWALQTDGIDLLIHPPYWQQAWFQFSVLTTGLLLIYLFFRFRILIYNRNIIRELLRHILKRVRRQTFHIVVKAAGKEVKIATNSILYVKSNGNYLEIYTDENKYLVREKIGNFLNIVPDPIEFLRVRRSYIVRIDKVSEKGKKHVWVAGKQLDVGETYLKELDKILL